MINKVVLFLTFAVLLSIIGCPAGFESPLQDKAKAKLDKALLGKWQGEDRLCFTIAQFNENEYTITFTENEKTVVLQAFSTQVGTLNFLNCRLEENKQTVWLIAQYDVTKEKFTFRLISDSFLKENKLLEEKENGSAPKLLDFLQEHLVSPDTLGETQVLIRVEEPQGEPLTQTTELQGIWKITHLEREGVTENVENFKDTTMIFDGNKLVINFGSEEQQDISIFTIDPSQSPKLIDIKPNKGDAVVGIYKIEGDQVTIAIGETIRPTNFEKTTPASKRALFILSKQKKE